MKRTMVAAALIAAFAVPGVAASAKWSSWGSLKSWVKRNISRVVGKIKDPQIRQAIDDVRQHVNSLRGKLRGLRPQYRALVGYLSVAAARARQGKDLTVLLPLIAKIKESTEKIGAGGVNAVRSWFKENRKSLYRLGGNFKNLYRRATRQFKNRVQRWWKRMKRAARKLAE